MSDQPRIPPLPREERDDEIQESLTRATGSADRDMNIFSTLVRHRKVFDRWLRFAGTLLQRGTIPDRDRELLIMRTAVNTGADYEWGHHVPIAERAGITSDEIAAIAVGPDAGSWSDFDAALLRAADELHTDSRIGDATWATLAERYEDTQLIEACMVVGNYHLVAFTLKSCGTPLEEGYDGLPS